MSTVVTEEGNTVTILLGGPPAARLFGLPFLLVGVYLSLQWAGGVADLAMRRAQVGEMLFGSLLLLVLALAFLVPGWVLTLGRSIVTIDEGARTVTSERDLRVYKRRSTRALSEFERVEIAHLSGGSSNASKSRTAQFQVELASARGAAVLVGLFEDFGEATAFGRQLGGRLGMTVADRRTREREAETVDED